MGKNLITRGRSCSRTLSRYNDYDEDDDDDDDDDDADDDDWAGDEDDDGGGDDDDRDAGNVRDEHSHSHTKIDIRAWRVPISFMLWLTKSPYIFSSDNGF